MSTELEERKFVIRQKSYGQASEKTLRDYFAAEALPALLNEQVPEGEHSTAALIAASLGGRLTFQGVFAAAAYSIADAMLAERAK